MKFHMPQGLFAFKSLLIRKNSKQDFEQRSPLYLRLEKLETPTKKG